VSLVFQMADSGTHERLLAANVVLLGCWRYSTISLLGWCSASLVLVFIRASSKSLNMNSLHRLHNDALPLSHLVPRR